MNRLKPFVIVALLATLNTQAEEVFDVAVYGGVPCGFATAVAAAREGARVVLIEPTQHVGGLNTSGLVTAETEHMLPWTIGGVALEFYQRLGQRYHSDKPAFFFDSATAEDVIKSMLAEAKVSVRYHSHLAQVEKNGTQIQRLVLSDRSVISAKVFVDASYEGDLMARAGVEYTWGRESRTEYGEEAAGIRFDKQPRKAVTVDELGNLLPGISAWARDLKEGEGDKKVMNYNWRLCYRFESSHNTME